jgi:hypothetical protein
MELTDLEGEIWKDVVGWEGLYQVSDKGRVKSLSRIIDYMPNRSRKTSIKVLNTYIDVNGYKSVYLYSMDHVRTKCKVHRLVAEVFVLNPDNKPHINHIDGDKLNNTKENLEFCTPSENHIHAFEIGLRVPCRLGLFGKDNPSSKKVIQTNKEGDVIGVFDSVTIASAITGLGRSSISACCTGRYKSLGGCNWNYY